MPAADRPADAAAAPQPYVEQATRQYQQGQLDPAAQAARRALTLDPTHVGALSVLAAALHGLGRYEEALRAALEAARLEPASDVACARVGSILDRLGRLREAEAQFRKAEKLGGPSKPYSLVSFDRAQLERVATLGHDLAVEITHHFGPRAPAGCRHVVMTCCDAKYFARYGFNFVNSFAQNAAGDNLLHVHIVDPGPGLDLTLEKIGRQVRINNLLVTTETSPFAAQSESLAAHTYYSCSRFLGLVAFMEQHRKPIVLLDVDAIVEGPFDTVIEASARSDIGLIRRNVSHSPWLDVPAWFLLANPTAGAARYFELVRAYILHFMTRGEFRWHLDQAALHCVLRMLESPDSSPAWTLAKRLLGAAMPWRTGRLPAPPRVEWMPEAKPPLWELGHSYEEKLKDPHYTRYSYRDGTETG